MGRQEVIPRPTIERLPLYLRCLSRLDDNGVDVVSSEELGRVLGVTSVQIRKDLAYFGEFGRRGVGYDVRELIRQIKEILGVNRTHKLALVGAGHLGQALARYEGFSEYGFSVGAIFDADPSKVGGDISGYLVLPAASLEEVVREQEMDVGVITVPASAAQKVAEQLVKGGVKAIWNFAPIRLEVPANVEVRQENLTVGLLALSYYLAHQDD